MVYDVIIVGAGAAGLTSAYRIHKADSSLNILILEANDRVGGRTLTVPVNVGDGQTEKFDLGGQWVGSSQTHVQNMIKELDLHTYPQYTEGKKVMQLGESKVSTYTGDIPAIGLMGLIQLQFFLWKAERMATEISMTDPYSSRYAAQLDGVTLHSFIKKNLTNTAARHAIEAACRVSFGTEPTRMGAMFFLAFANAAGGVMKVFEAKEGAAQEARVKGGTQQISELLAGKIGKENVLLGHAITSVTQTEEHVVMTTENGKRFTAKRAILAIPPNLLIKLKFDPPLTPHKKLIYENMPMGHLIKFIVVYKKAFWRENGFSGEIVSTGGESEATGVSTGPLGICFDATTDNGTPAIVGFIAARQGVEWHTKTESEREAAVIEGLARTLVSQAQDCVSYTEKVWADEPYIGGCPGVFGVPGTMYAFPHSRLPFDKLHFAGTETATVWTNFISGAIQSGERAAAEVLHNLRPQLLTEDDLRGTCYDPKSISKEYKRKGNWQTTFSYMDLMYLAVVFVAIFAVVYFRYCKVVQDDQRD